MHQFNHIMIITCNVNEYITMLRDSIKLTIENVIKV